MDGLTRRHGLALGTAGLLGFGLARASVPPDDPEPRWSPRASMPLRTQEIYAAAHEGEVWVAGGLSPDAEGPKLFGELGVSARVVAYDPPKDRWREAAALPAPRHHAHLASHDGRLYAVGGFVPTEDGAWTMTPSVLVLDGDAWRKIAPLPVPQAETVCASVAGRLHCVTGRRPTGTENAAWAHHADTNAHLAYDAGEDRWYPLAPAPTARNSASGGTVGSGLFVVGGRTVSGGNSPAFEVYDADADRWARLPDMPESRGGLAAAVLGRSLVAIGGEWFGPDGSGVYADTLVFDLDRQSWSTAREMPTPRHGLGLAVIDGTAYAVGGATQASGNGTSDTNEALILH